MASLCRPGGVKSSGLRDWASPRHPAHVLSAAMTAGMSLAGSALAMTLIVAARYLAVSGGFAWITRVRRPGLYDDKANQLRREIGWELGAAATYGIPAGRPRVLRVRDTGVRERKISGGS